MLCCSPLQQFLRSVMDFHHIVSTYSSCIPDKYADHAGSAGTAARRSHRQSWDRGTDECRAPAPRPGNYVEVAGRNIVIKSRGSMHQSQLSTVSGSLVIHERRRSTPSHFVSTFRKYPSRTVFDECRASQNHQWANYMGQRSNTACH